MRVYADLHIHGRFSRATSTSLNFDNLEKYARIKGINLLGTGDFTHPEWIKEINEKLSDDGTGILKTKTGFPFVLQTEISLIYTKNGKGRRIHVVILSPSLSVVDKITKYFKKFGRIDYDGRPIFKIDAENLVRDLKKIDDKIEIIPAHIWTPWFGLLGEMSGFDSVEEAFGSQAKNIFALETGLSSDPEMNWMLSSLDRFTLVSFSDLHSYWPWRIGREATIFNFEIKNLKELTYDMLINAIRNKNGYIGTIEVDPGYGKYHFDGHRVCGVRLTPEESKKNNYICPVCKKPLTRGVMGRVEQLADRKFDYEPKNKPFVYHLLPLSEIISFVYGKAVSTKFVWGIYDKMLNLFGDELKILLEVPEDKLKEFDSKLSEYIIKNRNNQLIVSPGYDGIYGKIIEEEEDIISNSDSNNLNDNKSQKSLNEF